jgi:small multidrug resistance pump
MWSKLSSVGFRDCAVDPPTRGEAAIVPSTTGGVKVLRFGKLRKRRYTWGQPTRHRFACAMDKTVLAILVTIGFSVVGVTGDYFLKLASESDESLKSKWFYIGFAVYATTAFGWVFVMKHLKLATIGVVYSVSMIVLLTTIGVIFFRETLTYVEMAGLAMAIGSLVLLSRFS